MYGIGTVLKISIYFIFSYFFGSGRLQTGSSHQVFFWSIKKVSALFFKRLNTEDKIKIGNAFVMRYRSLPVVADNKLINLFCFAFFHEKIKYACSFSCTYICACGTEKILFRRRKIPRCGFNSESKFAIEIFNLVKN